MSEKPRDGVIAKFGQTHDVKNLFVSDGSQLTSGAACDPTLTIVALAIRQADHIATRMPHRDIRGHRPCAIPYFRRSCCCSRVRRAPARRRRGRREDRDADHGGRLGPEALNRLRADQPGSARALPGRGDCARQRPALVDAADEPPRPVPDRRGPSCMGDQPWLVL